MQEYTVKVYSDRTHWLQNGQLHREDGPAIEYADGSKEWFQMGKLHREDGPAVEWADGDKWWYKNGQRHREDGPAIEYADGSKEWYRKGKLHREDGPAVEWADGDKWWYKNGQRHREDGPAIERYNDIKAWYLNGERLTESEFNKRVNPPNEKDIYRLFMVAMDGGIFVQERVSATTSIECGICKIKYSQSNNVLHVWLRRPGLLIGKGGSNINKLEKYLDLEIHLHEVVNLWDFPDVKL